MAGSGTPASLRGAAAAEEGRPSEGGVTVVTHSSTRASHGHGSTDPGDVRHHDEAEAAGAAPEQRPVDRPKVGWRYGSALAAARALNARPARA